VKPTIQDTALEPMFSRRFLYTLIIPLIIEQVLMVSIGMADTVMIASAGESAVSAISLVDSITILIVQLFAAFATGGAVVASQYLGNKDHASANAAAKQLILLSLLASITLLILCMPFRRQIISFILALFSKNVGKCIEESNYMV
jgi:Na+-driven multidrug efflux pump